MEERIERTERSVAPIVHKILFEEAVSSKKPRVAAYCRVSTDLEDQAQFCYAGKNLRRKNKIQP